MTKPGTIAKPQKPDCFNAQWIKPGYCSVCIWDWKCQNKRGWQQTNELAKECCGFKF